MRLTLWTDYARRALIYVAAKTEALSTIAEIAETFGVSRSVLAVVVWIGGVAMVRPMVLPAIRRGEPGPNRLSAFKAVKRRFS